MHFLVLYFRFRCLRSLSNLFVLNLTIADFLLCVGTLPMLIIASFSGHWLFDVIGRYFDSLPNDCVLLLLLYKYLRHCDIHGYIERGLIFYNFLSYLISVPYVKAP